MKTPNFFVDYDTILARIGALDPVQYARSRNFLDGHISYLSPFITHGVVSTKTVAEIVLQEHKVRDSEKLLAELGWREFFHRVWQAKGDEIFDDLRSPQAKVTDFKVSTNLVAANTGIKAIDQTVSHLTETGYMHNHARMWFASLAGNIAQTHWYQPARWMYYHLLDGDLASNTLSWQWIVGSFSHKKYYANQENLNKYTGHKEHGTWLDIAYDDFDVLEIPPVLAEREALNLTNEFPASTAQPIENSAEPVLLYSIWNLDPTWQSDITARRVLWIEPDMHKTMALSPLRWRFVTHWAAQIKGLEIFVGSVAQLFPAGTDGLEIITREYPATAHWPGKRDPRDWLYPNTQGYFKNFFSFWKLAQKELPGLRKLHQPHKS